MLFKVCVGNSSGNLPVFVTIAKDEGTVVTMTLLGPPVLEDGLGRIFPPVGTPCVMIFIPKIQNCKCHETLSKYSALHHEILNFHYMVKYFIQDS